MSPAAVKPLPQRLAWLAALSAGGFALPFLFADRLALPRNLYLVPFLLGAGALVAAYARWSAIRPVPFLLHRWGWGLLGGAVAGGLVVANVLGQPASAGPGGAALAFNVLWLGLLYGAVDAALLNVVPAHALLAGLGAGGAAAGWSRRLGWGVAALLASLAVTAAYHLGYAEFRGAGVAGPLIGNAILTLAYLLTGSPLAPVLGHVAMHVAAVLHGFSTAVQLPPHL